MKKDHTVIWTLRMPTGKWVECVVRFVPGGVEVEIALAGSTVISRVFATGAEAIGWAEEERKAWKRGR